MVTKTGKPPTTVWILGDQLNPKISSLVGLDKSECIILMIESLGRELVLESRGDGAYGVTLDALPPGRYTVSAHADARGRMVVSDEYLTKPFTKDSLLKAVAAHAAPRKADSEIDATITPG